MAASFFILIFHSSQVSGASFVTSIESQVNDF